MTGACPDAGLLGSIPMKKKPSYEELQKRVEELLETEENFRSLAENANDGILIASEEGLHVYANRRASEITGHTVDELLTTRIEDLAHPDELEYILEKKKRRMQGIESPETYRTRIVTKGGVTLPIEVTGARTIWKGEPSVLVIIRDITGRTRMEDELRASEGRFRAIFEGSLDAIFLVDPETGKVLDANPTGSELLWKDHEEIVGLHYLEFLPSRWEEDARKAYETLFEEEERTISLETEFLKSNGREVPVEVLAQLIQIDGVPVIHALVRDITDRKRMEEELLKTQKLESLGVLAGGIAHDFNNILTAISTNISMARLYGNLEEDVSQMMADAEKASVRARNLTQQLLAFARGGAPVRKAVSLSRILHENTEFALSGSNVKYASSIPDGLWQVQVDEGQIGQVIHNLVINAVQAMPEGGTIQVGTQNVSQSDLASLPLKPGRYVKIFVKDQGIGIPGRHLDKIFDPFFTTKQKGSGLGLTSSFTIVKNHEGHIHVDSVVDEGTTVDVYLPASQEARMPETSVGEGLCPGRGRVLLIDDEKLIRRAGREALGRLGYEVTLAPDGAEGIRLYEEAMREGRDFDLVLLDLTIPGGTGGKDAVRELLRIDPRAKVIASSGYSNDPVMADYRAYGFSDVIIKPYRVEDLGEVLYKVMKE